MGEKLSAGNAANAKSLFAWWNGKHSGEKKTQAELADKMGITAIVLNAKLNGHRTLTANDARKIADYFGVRFEYVMGYDDAKTEDDLFNAYEKKTRSLSQRKISSFTTLAELCGYEVVSGGTDCLVSSENGVKTEDYWILRQGEKERWIYYSQLNDFVEELSDYLSVRLKRVVNIVGGKENG